MAKEKCAFAGVDVGSSTAKTVLVDAERRILGRSIVPSGFDHAGAARASFSAALRDAGIDERRVCYVVGTGYGRKNMAFADEDVSEISCHGRGAWFLFPEVGLVIDIGGQDSKAIRVGPTGKVVDFAMNEKCAAGTGRFLEVMARGLEVPIERLGEISRGSRREVRVGSMCTVFAESEIISLIAQGKDKGDIVAGLHKAIAERNIQLARRVGICKEVCMTGGVARNAGVVEALGELFQAEVKVPERPEFVGALGAALLATERGPRSGWSAG